MIAQSGDYAAVYFEAEFGGYILGKLGGLAIKSPLFKRVVSYLGSKIAPKLETVTFYSVQSADDVARLKAGGAPWPIGPTQAHLGQGIYSWATKAEAESYLALKVRRNPNLKLQVAALEIEATALSKLKVFKVPTDDVLANEWLAKYSSLGKGQGLPHGFQYIQGNAGIGTEHYFSSEVFNLFKIK